MQLFKAKEGSRKHKAICMPKYPGSPLPTLAKRGIAHRHQA
jgi:hypothetical protein